MAEKIKKKLYPNTGLTSLTPEILRKRILFFFGIGLVASLFAFLSERLLLLQKSPLIFSPLNDYYHNLLALSPASFFFGSLLIYLKPLPPQSLQRIDILVVSFNILTLSFLFAALSPANSVLFPYSFLLLTHALFVPFRPQVQRALGGLTVFSFLSGKMLSYYFLSETQRVLMMKSPEAFWISFGFQIIEVILISWISVLISQQLFRSREILDDTKHLGSYVIEKELGAGGMGKIYAASHAFLCRPTALKVMQLKHEDLETTLSRFEQEVKLCSSLSHPNTVTIFDYGRCPDNTVYYAMELLEGMDLQRIVEKFGPQPVSRTLYILHQTCSALAEAHSLNIIHRDIKTSNLFLTERGGLYDFVKVLDFGLAKEISCNSSSGLTEKDVFLGTPRYIAPECVYHKERIDPRTDIYMLGSVAFWLLTGHAPFEAPTDIGLIVDHVNTKPKKPSSVIGLRIPEALDGIILKCLEKQQEDRYQNIAELSEALHQVPIEDAWTQEKARDWWKSNFQVEGQGPASQSEPIFPTEYQPIKILPTWRRKTG
jgi:serine/threonine protein kinase